MRSDLPGIIKSAIYAKAFGQAAPSLDKYENVIDYFSDDLKDIYFILKELENIDDPDILLQIFNECENVHSFGSIEVRAKREWTQLYNEGLFNPQNKQSLDFDTEILKIDEEITIAQANDNTTKLQRLENKKKTFEMLKTLGVNVYDAGTDFKIIQHSIGAYQGDRNNHITNAKKSWNRESRGSKHFCASYIRSDMMGIPNGSRCIYGFSKIDEDALYQAIPNDAGTSVDPYLVFKENSGFTRRSHHS